MLVLDEFQEVSDIDRGLPRLMRAVFQRQPEVAHIYLGSRRHAMERIFNDENEPFWRSAKRIELGLIAPERFAPFLSDRFRTTGKRLSATAAARLLAVTCGHPYATQELAYFVWQRTPPDAEAGVEEVAGGLRDVIRGEASDLRDAALRHAHSRPSPRSERERPATGA